jgi:hypothetical protein
VRGGGGGAHIPPLGAATHRPHPTPNSAAPGSSKPAPTAKPAALGPKKSLTGAKAASSGAGKPPSGEPVKGRRVPSPARVDEVGVKVA